MHVVQLGGLRPDNPAGLGVIDDWAAMKTAILREGAEKQRLAE